ASTSCSPRRPAWRPTPFPERVREKRRGPFLRPPRPARPCPSPARRRPRRGECPASPGRPRPTTARDETPCRSPSARARASPDTRGRTGRGRSAATVSAVLPDRIPWNAILECAVDGGLVAAGQAEHALGDDVALDFAGAGFDRVAARAQI